jgi:hypothetical protein
MKPILLLILNLVFLWSYGQKKSEEDKVLSHAHVIYNNGGWFAEVEGYQLYVEDVKGDFNAGTVKKVKKKYSLDKELESIVNPNLFTPHELFVTEIPSEKDTSLRAVYVVQYNQYNVKVFDFVSVAKRDNFLELVLIKAFLEDRLPASAYTVTSPDSISIAGQKVALGGRGTWMKPHSIHVGEGQMNWGEFRNRQDAERMV